MAFSGADYANPNKFLAYRKEIWTYLEGMISAGRLKTVSEVWPELKRNDPASHTRLHRFHDQLTLSRHKLTDIEVFNLISRYPDIIDDKQYYTMKPADPYLIVYARRLRVPIITDEKSLAERTGKWNKKKLNIPDVCDREGMKKCIHLEDFLKGEGVIPKDAVLT